MSRLPIIPVAWMWLSVSIVNPGCNHKNASRLPDAVGPVAGNPNSASKPAAMGPGARPEPNHAVVSVAKAFFDVLRWKGTAPDATLVSLPFVLGEAKGEVCPSKGDVAQTAVELAPLLDCVRNSEFFIRALANNPNPVFDTGATAASLLASVAPDGPPAPPGTVPVVASLPNSDFAIFLVLLVSGSKVAELRVVMTFEPN